MRIQQPRLCNPVLSGVVWVFKTMLGELRTPRGMKIETAFCRNWFFIWATDSQSVIPHTKMDITWELVRNAIGLILLKTPGIRHSYSGAYSLCFDKPFQVILVQAHL